MKITLLTIFLTVILFMNTSRVTYAGDSEWRSFGETAAVLFGIRALTGWDPVGEILDYPRNRILRRSAPTYHYQDVISCEPTVVRCTKISAYPCQHPLHGSHTHEESSPTIPSNYPAGNNMGSNYTPLQQYLAPTDKQPPQYQPAIKSSPNQDAAKPPIEIGRRIDGDTEIITWKIWIAPHWEKSFIENHWRGDTWIESHWESKWIEGGWEQIEEKRPKSPQTYPANK